VQVNPDPSMTPEHRARMRDLLGLLAAAVALVLLIACGNVANLLLAHAAEREREIAIRLALGSGRGALVRQLVTESLLLAGAGAALGLVLAPWLLPLLGSVWTPQELPAAGGAGRLNLRVLAFTLAASIATVLLCGLAPAWSAARTDVSVALKSGAPQSGRRHGPLRRLWVVAQVTLSVTLVLGGSLVLRSLQRILAVDPGYRPERVALATVDLSIAGYSAERGLRFFSSLVEQISALPGVRSASLAKSSPAVDWSDRVMVRSDDQAADLQADRNTVAPGYFRTLGIPLVAGRDFTQADDRPAPKVAIVSRSLAGRLWPGQDAIGKRILVPAPLEVVGVAADSLYRSLLADPPLLLYVPLLQNYDSIARVMAAAQGDPRPLAGALRRAIQQADPDLPVMSVSTMEEQIAQSLWHQRAAASLVGLFGALAIALACAGLHGAVAHAVARQTRELGIRMALGAGRSDVLRRVVGGALRLTAAGIALGLVGALWVEPLLSSLLYGVRATDPLVLGVVPALFLALAAVASFPPAQRAARIEPAVALRQE